MTRLLFENLSKEKLTLSILLNINCSRIPFIVVNPSKEDLRKVGKVDFPSEHVRVAESRRLSIRENTRGSLHVKGVPQKVSLVEVASEDELPICSRSVHSEEQEWSDAASCSSFLTQQPSRLKQKRKKLRWHDQIQNVLDFGNKAKQITRVKLMKNPTIEDLKRSAVRLAKRRKQNFNLGKKVTEGSQRSLRMKTNKIFEESRKEVDQKYISILQKFFEQHTLKENILKLDMTVPNFESLQMVRNEYRKQL